ncbi:MAG: hypothetical protein AAF449_02045 [Myxococcota bacterium]
MQSLALLLALAAAPAASGPPNGEGFGVGVQTTLRGLGSGELAGLGPDAGISVVFDQGKWRADAALNFLFVDDRVTAFGIGGRFLYQLHKTSSADFSFGGGTGFQFLELGGSDGGVAVYFEGVAQIRFFVVKNVAINGTLGLGIRVGDGPVAFGLTGQAQGSFGMTYFF